jgi:hypothetical protein
MLDIFKGAAATLVAWVLTFWYLSTHLPDFALIAALPCVAFALPLILPNARWVFGNGAFTAAIIIFVVSNTDGSVGGALVLANSILVAIAAPVGIGARYAIRALRAWHRKDTNAPPLPKQELPPITTRSVVLTVCAGVGLLVSYSVFVMFSAQASARRIAAGRPYCIQVESGSTYRTLMTRLDLLGFYMMSDYRRHSILVVKNGRELDLYHWSYRKNAFEADAYAGTPIYCEPAMDFLASPRRFRQERKGSLSFMLEGHAFSIPEAYAPTVSSKRIAIFAAPEDFAPSGSGRAPHWQRVEITFGRATGLDVWRKKQGAEWQVAFQLLLPALSVGPGRMARVAAKALGNGHIVCRSGPLLMPNCGRQCVYEKESIRRSRGRNQTLGGDVCVH